MKTQRLARRALVAAAVFGSVGAHAGLPTSGTCGFVAKLPVSLGYVYSQSTHASHAVSTLGTLTFSSTGQVTMGLSMAVQNIQSSPATQNTASEDCVIQAGQNACTTSNTGKLKFKNFAPLSADVPGVYSAKLTDPFNANSVIRLNLRPVNNGQTILMQWFTSDDEQARVATCQF